MESFKMKDTTQEAHKKQLEIILSKTAHERAMMGVDMMESTYKIVKQSIKNDNPQFNEREVIAELFSRYYKNDFSDNELRRIVAHLKQK